MDSRVTNLSAQSDIDRVRDATDLAALIGEHIALRPRGREHVGRCPFHDDHTPSMSVVTHKGNAFYKCHSCGASGDAFTFVMEYHRKAFPEALEYLADRCGIALTRMTPATQGGGPNRTDLKKANDFACRFFQHTLGSERGVEARRILAERGLTDDTIATFQLGLAPEGFTGLVEAIRQRNENTNAAAAAGLLKARGDGSFYDAFRHRLTFPIHDELGNTVAFGGRRIAPDDEPKYLNSSESPVFHKSRTLYGLHLARRAIIDNGQAIVTEGYTDVIACHQNGITNVVGTLGTALTRDHAKLLSRLCETVVLIFDGDDAGQRAADRGVEVFFSAPVDVRICVLPDGTDPDDLLRQPGGVEQFHAAIEVADDALAYRVKRFSGELASQTTVSGREKLLTRFLQELGDVGFGEVQGVRKRDVLERLSGLLGLPSTDLNRLIGRRRQTAAPAASPGPAGSAPAGSAPVPHQPVDASIRLVSRARRLAERAYLSILIFDPSTGTAAVTVEGRSAAAAADLFSVDDFDDDAARRIFETIVPWLNTDDRFSVPQLLSALTDETHRQIASSLYFEGERRCGQDGELSEEAIIETACDLHHCRENEHLRRQATQLGQLSPDGKVSALQELLERRRQRGDLATAISQGVRP
jgi:DNA primase